MTQHCLAAVITVSAGAAIAPQQLVTAFCYG